MSYQKTAQGIQSIFLQKLENKPTCGRNEIKLLLSESMSEYFMGLADGKILNTVLVKSQTDRADRKKSRLPVKVRIKIEG